MADSFWKSKKNLFILAPMEDVTDTVFRQIVLRNGRPDIFFTEFTSSDGMCSSGRANVEHRLKFTEEERPIVAQIWGNDPNHYYETAKMIQERGFDGIDINMGCPVDKIIKNGACSALINNPSRAAEIIKATKEGAGGMPVSVKTRIGFNEIKTEEWISFVLEQEVDALTVHGRTVKEKSAVPNHWEEINKIPALRDRISPNTVIIGNGDIKSHSEGLQKIEQYKLDGVMIGRGIFQNVWIFDPAVDPEAISIGKRLSVLLEHTKLFEETWKNEKNFGLMKKFFKIYAAGFDGAAELRELLMRTNNYAEVQEIIKQSKYFNEQFN